jgi:hypothetical protein
MFKRLKKKPQSQPQHQKKPSNVSSTGIPKGLVDANGVPLKVDHTHYVSSSHQHTHDYSDPLDPSFWLEKAINALKTNTKENREVTLSKENREWLIRELLKLGNGLERAQLLAKLRGEE